MISEHIVRRFKPTHLTIKKLARDQWAAPKTDGYSDDNIEDDIAMFVGHHKVDVVSHPAAAQDAA